MNKMALKSRLGRVNLGVRITITEVADIIVMKDIAEVMVEMIELIEGSAHQEEVDLMIGVRKGTKVKHVETDSRMSNMMTKEVEGEVSTKIGTLQVTLEGNVNLMKKITKRKT